jgi:outer membrane protein assembly factor BamB
VIGNHRLVSSWPARGGPVVHDGKIFFSASIWPFMGIFIHAVDAESGKILWTNSGDGTNYTVQPHGAPSFAAVVPQGPLVISGDNLVVPGGRSTPAVFDLATGKLRHFLFDKKNGGHHVMAGQDLYFVAGGAYNMADGKRVSSENPSILDGTTLVFEDKGSIYGRSAKPGKERETHFAIGPRDGPGKVFMKAGDRVYTAGDGKVAAYDVTGPKGERMPAWMAEIEGDVHHMLAANEKLFVVTNDARVYCFGVLGKSQGTVVAHRLPDAKPLTIPAKDDRFAEFVEGLVAEPALWEGYSMALGVGSGALITEVLGRSNTPLVVFDRSANEVDLLRRRCDEAQLYGSRVAAHVGDIATMPLPPYFASLIVCEDVLAAGFAPDAPEFVTKTFHALRPYGGTAVLVTTSEQHQSLAAIVGKAGLGEQAALSWKEGITRLTRRGALPSTDDWTHQYGNPEQSGISRDQMVKAPLGLLWFGGATHDGILPRHGHGPSPQVAGGRLFIEGPHKLRAVDVYTGRVLWEKEMKDFGRFYDTTRHFAGAGEIGSNYVSLPDRVYAVHGKSIVEIDAATGETLKEMTLGEGSPGDDRAPYWGYIGARGDYLIATSSPVKISVTKGEGAEPAKSQPEKVPGFWEVLAESQYSSGSRRLIVLNRHTGDVVWKRDAALNFRHNNIAISADTIFCTDAIAKSKLSSEEAAKLASNVEPTLYALDLKTGDETWKTSENIFGTFFNYSAQHDILLQAGSKYRDRAKDEVGRGMTAYRGTTGEVLWENPDVDYGGPCLLWRDRIITNGAGGFALDLLTGKPTGWSYQRMYGCNTAVGSENLLTFRSGAAGFYDMANDGGTGNIGGFRSSCTNNLIAANGVLNAPDYTRTCSCAYQNQTSLALVHMPEAEFWTFGAKHTVGRLGVNLGAPGDRRDPEGTLWTEFPSVGGPSDEIQVSLTPADPEVFRIHSSIFSGTGLKWVAASGVLGVESISIPVDGDGAWQVRLHFAEPEAEAKPGERVMDVVLQGKTILAGLDVIKEAGGVQCPLVKKFEAEASGGKIVVGLVTRGSRPSVLSGVELLRK